MAPAFPLLMELFPKAKYIFNTRQWVPSVESYMQLAQFMPLLVYYTGAQFQVRIIIGQCDSYWPFSPSVLVGASSNTIWRPLPPSIAQGLVRQQGLGYNTTSQTVAWICCSGKTSFIHLLSQYSVVNIFCLCRSPVLGIRVPKKQRQIRHDCLLWGYPLQSRGSV